MTRSAGAASVLAALALVACGDAPQTAPTVGASATGATCGPTERPSLQGGGHLVGTNSPPVAYSSTPGTSGWHAGGQPKTGVFGPDAPLTEPELVLVLEIGQVVAAYDAAALSEPDTSRLAALAQTTYDGVLTVTPFAGDMGAPLVLNAWGIRQPCMQLDEAALAAFIQDHADPTGHG